jgi:hypothetical protein
MRRRSGAAGTATCGGEVLARATSGHPDHWPAPGGRGNGDRENGVMLRRGASPACRIADATLRTAVGAVHAGHVPPAEVLRRLESPAGGQLPGREHLGLLPGAIAAPPAGAGVAGIGAPGLVVHRPPIPRPTAAVAAVPAAARRAGRGAGHEAHEHQPHDRRPRPSHAGGIGRAAGTGPLHGLRGRSDGHSLPRLPAAGQPMATGGRRRAFSKSRR